MAKVDVVYTVRMTVEDYDSVERWKRNIEDWLDRPLITPEVSVQSWCPVDNQGRRMLFGEDAYRSGPLPVVGGGA